jgi:hypothetical protein
MTCAEAIAFLREFNLWRRGNDSIPQPQPGKASEAIDAACAHIERLERERDELRQALREIADGDMRTSRARAKRALETQEAGK